MPELIGARFLQGIGGGGLMTLTQTAISEVVGPRERVRYQGLFTGAFALAAVAGPVIGGSLTSALSWRWVFYVNVPVGVLALLLIAAALPASTERQRHRIDVLGVLLLVIWAGALLLVSLAGSLFAWTSATALGLGGGIALEAIGLGGLAHQQADLPWFLAALAVLGLGMGVAMPHATVIVQNAVPREQMGVATAAMSFLRSMGGALGVAVSAGVMAGQLGPKLASLGGGLDAKRLLEGGMSAIHALPSATQAEVAGAFGLAISASFLIGGAVMALALALAMTLRGTDLKQARAVAPLQR
ncbi:MFS transporter [Rhodobacter viridis]|uniref:MFS transporter n=1 Tax=Rhodobacter viridis TaxID=1054202 RepID=A0A318TZL4_9RHOB|nr:MFS transporter [Rhodobacter viridis]PYF10530.1 MFS transporter [Rhodobacter viridis]